MKKAAEGLPAVQRVAVPPFDGGPDVTLTRPVTLPTERILTSGCGGGITFRIDHRLFPRLSSRRRVRPEALAERMKDLVPAAAPDKAPPGIPGPPLAHPDGVSGRARDDE